MARSREPQQRIDWAAVEQAVLEAFERAENECECQDVRCTVQQHPDPPNGPVRRRERCTQTLDDARMTAYAALIPAHFSPDDSANWVALCGPCNEFRIKADIDAGVYEGGYLHRGMPYPKGKGAKRYEERPYRSR